jgi:uncharacterized membrane protein
MNKLNRILKHRWRDETDAKRALGAGALERIQQRVEASERHHSGEIRVCIEASLPLSYLWRDATPRERAVTLFGKLRVWDTECNNGVLIYLLLAERSIDIVADRGVSRHVQQEQWDAIVASMRESFRMGRFEEGVIASIDAVNRVLVKHFPLAVGEVNPNELPDEPQLR